MASCKSRTRSSLRVFYAAGPGDVIGTYRHWCEGRDDPHQVADLLRASSSPPAATSAAPPMSSPRIPGGSGLRTGCSGSSIGPILPLELEG